MTLLIGPDLPTPRASRPQNMPHIGVIFLTDVFQDFALRHELCVELQCEGFRISTRIVDCDFVHQCPKIFTSVTFDGVKLLSMRMAAKIEPELVVKPYGIDHQRVALPVPDGVPVPGWVGILRVLAPIHENLPVA